MTTLITGHEGEVGVPLCQALRQLGVDIAYFDTVDPNNFKARRLIHLAGANQANSAQQIAASNISYLSDVLSKAETMGVEEFIFFSTASVYGQADEDDLSEDTLARADDTYALSKRLGERLVEDYPGRSLVLRLPGVLEQRRATNFLGRAFERLRQHEDVTISNAHRLFNNFVHIPDLAVFLAQLSLHKPFDAIHLGALKQLTLAEVLNHIHSGVNSRAQVHISDETRPFFNLSIRKAVEEYGYQPGDPATIIKAWISTRLQLQATSHGR